MQYGLKRGALFWQRMFAGWLRVAKMEVVRPVQHALTGHPAKALCLWAYVGRVGP